MPLYEYRCAKCATLVEVIQGFKDPPLKKCKSCGGRLNKLISRSGFVLKGSGWYQSDYNAKATSPKSDSPSADVPAEKASPAAGDGDTTSGTQAPKDKPVKTSGKPAGSSERHGKSSGKGGSTKD